MTTSSHRTTWFFHSSISQRRLIWFDLIWTVCKWSISRKEWSLGWPPCRDAILCRVKWWCFFFLQIFRAKNLFSCSLLCKMDHTCRLMLVLWIWHNHLHIYIHPMTKRKNQRKPQLLLWSTWWLNLYITSTTYIIQLVSWLSYHGGFAECANRQRARRSTSGRRGTDVARRNHGVRNAAILQRCRSSPSRQWSSSLGHGALPPRISSKSSLPVYVYMHTCIICSGPHRWLIQFHFTNYKIKGVDIYILIYSNSIINMSFPFSCFIQVTISVLSTAAAAKINYILLFLMFLLPESIEPGNITGKPSGRRGDRRRRRWGTWGHGSIWWRQKPSVQPDMGKPSVSHYMM